MRAVVAAGCLAAATVVLVALVRPGSPSPVGSLLSAVTAIATGLLLLVPGRRPAQRRPSLGLLGVGAVIWGTRQLLGSQILPPGTAFSPESVHLGGLVAALFVVAGSLSAVRERSPGVEGTPNALDGVLVGSTSALLVWRLGFAGALNDVGPDVISIAAVGLPLIVDTSVISLLLLLWLRHPDRSLGLALAGGVMYGWADLVTLWSGGRAGGPVPWWAAVLWCLAWPAVAAGMSRPPPTAVIAATARNNQTAQTRVSSLTSMLSFVLLLCSASTALVRPPLDQGSVLLILVVVCALGARERAIGVQRRALLDSLTRLASKDPLTGLGNRRALTQRLDLIAPGADDSVLTVDLDGFKDINDTLGYARGDQLLQAVAVSMDRVLPFDVEVFRVGGDEFAVIVPGPHRRAQGVADQLLAAVREAAESVPGTGSVQVTASVGVAALGACRADRVAGCAVVADHAAGVSADLAVELTPDVPPASALSADVILPTSLDILVGLAESGVALRAAKAAGRDRVERYDGPIAAQHRRGLLVERRLREAIRAGAVRPHYQPVVDLRTRRVVGVEALARWADGVLGQVAPDEFIPVAERSGLITELGRQVLCQSVRDIAAFEQAGLGPLRTGINASAAQLRRTGYADSVLALLEEMHVAPGAIILEVTESLFIDADDPALRELTALRSAGMHVGIDDFGSGYSSLAYLARMPADVLKIDRALTVQVLHDRRSRAVLRAIVDLAKSLPLDVVVEGIETPAVHDFLRDAGCEFGQGWLYGAAVPFEGLPAAVESINARSVLALAQPR